MEFDILEYLILLKKRWRFITIITLMFTLMAGVVSFFVLKPVYESDISVIIGRPKNVNSQNYSSSYNDVMMYQKMVSTYMEFVRSRTVIEDTITTLKLNINVEDLQNKISVTAKGDTEFLTIAVKSKNAEESMNIANQLAKSLKKISSDVKKEDNVQILDKAQFPTSPDTPKPYLNMTIAFILGFMLSIVIVIVMEYLDNTIKDPEEIEKLLNIPVIGTIPYMSNNNK
ncbi:YveK family protein [Clostridium oryzae]|uniref:Capsular polysaccharide type 8 biosynthesis protein cap8A n=1 Tax=Clostridium oryzae TaxID=1450648 RepID=A0A1V4IP21_9CLOT|nr:Wzz/FepE/Etk N-terminal domain-containing protein [Clostridium oryzae]OPJ61656.1 capsular polysaccharide type 8 biosynthesis protein cap8A [Clostridium oryzae]